MPARIGRPKHDTGDGGLATVAAGGARLKPPVSPLAVITGDHAN